jgi:hypothetical protein
MRRYLILLSLILTACAAATPTPNNGATAPAVIATAPSEAATRSPEPGFTLLPATPPSPVPPTSTPVPCVNDAQFVSDVTVPDFTQLVPGALIDKRWAVRNTGDCDWGPGYRLVFVEGNAMNAPGEHALYPARAGGEAVLQINMVAPDAPGEYTGKWQLRDPDGLPFGQVLFIKVTVIALPTPQP